MSLLDDNDNGIENTLIDPFNITVSNEAYPFPVEEYIPVTTPPVIDEATVVVPTLTPEGAEKFHQALNAELTTPESPAEEMTDTPQETAVVPSPEGDVRISLEEEEESLTKVSKTETEDMDLLESLVEVRDRLAEMGGISKDDVYQVESLVPGLITDKISLNRFSSIPTRMGLDVSLESVGSKIIETVKKILTAIVERLKRIFQWMANRAKDKVANTSGEEAKAAWKTTLQLAAKVDSLKGANAFKAKYGETEAGKKSSTNDQFIRLHAMSLFNQRVSNFNVGMLQIQKGTLSNRVKNAMGRLQVASAETEKAIKLLEAGKAVPVPNPNDFNASFADQDAFREASAKNKAMYAEAASPTTKLFENAVNVPDGGAIARETLIKYGKKMGDISVQLSHVQDGILSKNDSVMESIKHINIMINAVTNMLTDLTGMVMMYGAYYSNCVKTATHCSQILRSIGGVGSDD